MREAIWRIGAAAAAAVMGLAAPAEAQQRVWGQATETVRVVADPNAPPNAPAEEPPPAPEIIEAPPPSGPRMREGAEAHLRFLDRRTSSRGELVSPVGSTARYGQLTIEILACRVHAEGRPESVAFLRIRDEEKEAPVFSGWIFASSPSLSALDHPRYDVWVAECKTAEDSESAANE